MCLCAACFDQVCGYVLCAVFAYINAGVFFPFCFRLRLEILTQRWGKQRRVQAVLQTSAVAPTAAGFNSLFFGFFCCFFSFYVT